MASAQADFAETGHHVVHDPDLIALASALRARFETDFQPRFGADPQHNRNLVKRFGDSFEAARFFAAAPLVAALDVIGIADPVFCGPVVTHYTSHDRTGGSYGLPFHQDWPSMASSDRAAVIWVSLTDSGPGRHGLEVVPGGHLGGLLPGTQAPGGFTLDRQDYDRATVLEVPAGAVVLMSPFLPHRTYIAPDFEGWKLSLSRRADDLSCPAWAARGYANAYGNAVDRDLYRKFL